MNLPQFGRQTGLELLRIGGAPARDRSVHQPERGIGAVQPQRIAVRGVHLLGGIDVPDGQRREDHRCSFAGAPIAVSSAVSTVRPGPNAIEHTCSSAPGRAASRIAFSTNSTVALDMFP